MKKIFKKWRKSCQNEQLFHHGGENVLVRAQKCARDTFWVPKRVRKGGPRDQKWVRGSFWTPKRGPWLGNLCKKGSGSHFFRLQGGVPRKSKKGTGNYGARRPKSGRCVGGDDSAHRGGRLEALFGHFGGHLAPFLVAGIFGVVFDENGRPSRAFSRRVRPKHRLRRLFLLARQKKWRRHRKTQTKNIFCWPKRVLDRKNIFWCWKLKKSLSMKKIFFWNHKKKFFLKNW